MQWGEKMKKIIISLVLIVLLVALVLSIKSLYETKQINYQSVNQPSQNNETKNKHNSQYPSPQIDVLSQAFSENFMNRDVRNQYMHISKGMSKSKVERYYGNSEEHLKINNLKTQKYGNIAIYYQNDKVQRFFVIPNNVYIQAFTQVHGNRDKNYNNGTMLYDDNPFNQFSVKVYFDPNGQIKAIENVNQVSLSY